MFFFSFVKMVVGPRQRFGPGSARHWLTRDQRGLSPTSDIDNCFELGPDAFFPGRFQRSGIFKDGNEWWKLRKIEVMKLFET